MEDIVDEFDSPYILGVQSFQPYWYQEEDNIVPLVNDTPTNDETIVVDITYLESLHLASSVDNIPPCSVMKEDVVQKIIYLSL